MWRGRIDAARALCPSLASLLDAVESDDQARDRPLHEVTLRLVERAERVAEVEPTEPWVAFGRSVPELLTERSWAAAVAGFASFVALITLHEPDDLAAVAGLVKRFGHQKVARMHAEAGYLVDVTPEMPTTMRAIRQLAETVDNRRVLVGAGCPREEAEEIAAVCYQAAFWILMQDIDPASPGTPLSTVEEVRAMVDADDLQQWRDQFALIAAAPWGPDAAQLHDLVVAADRPLAAYAVRECTRIYRNRFEEQERLEVAKEIRRLVAVTGMSQREFARHIGTSASRLSTYVNGLVTPSAAMMLRISRVSRAIRDERLDRSI